MTTHSLPNNSFSARALVASVALTAVVVTACKSSPLRGGSPFTPPAAPEQTCRVALGPAWVPDGGTEVPRASAFVAPQSLLILQVEVPLRSLEAALDVKIPRRLAEERDRDLGIAGRLQYVVERGAFAASVSGDALVIEAPVHAHVQACAKGSCYAGCEPEARATVRVPLALDANYNFRSSSVHIDITRGCELRALGGLVRVDVTPIIQQRLAAETKNIEASVDRELPVLRPQAEQAWAELGRVRALPLGSCVVVAPEAVSQGPSPATADAARLRFGIVARPELRTRCGEASSLPPLPPLKEDRALPAEGEVHLGLVLASEAPAIGLEGAAIDRMGARARVTHATGRAAALRLELAGEVCGGTAARATQLSWAEDGRALHLGGVTLAAGEDQRLAALGLDGAALVQSLQAAPIVPPTRPADLKDALPALARTASDSRASVTAVISEAAGGSAGFRDDEPIAVVRLRGAVTIRVNDLK